MNNFNEYNEYNPYNSSQSNEEETEIMSERLLKWGIIRYNWRVLTLTTNSLRYDNSGLVTSVQLDKYTKIYQNQSSDGFVIQNEFKYT